MSLTQQLATAAPVKATCSNACTSKSCTNRTPDATPEQVQQWLEADEAVLIDVREPDEHAREHIRGSQVIPLSRFSLEEVTAAAKSQRRVVLHCRSGTRGGEALRMCNSLKDAGYEVRNMTGGIEAWKQQNLPVVVDTSVSRIGVLRQVQITIGICVLTGSALTWLVHPNFLIIPAFFGAGLIFAGTTGYCGLAKILARAPWNKPA